MSKPVSEAPEMRISLLDTMSGEMPNQIAREAERLGPVMRLPLVYGPTNDMIFLVGPEANRAVFNTQREAFSHDAGWTPIIGDLFGDGLLNQDNPAWARSRKIWNPAFTAAYMESYLPLLQRIIAGHLAGWAARGAVDVYAEARAITFHVAASVLAGIDNTPEVERLQRLFFTLLPRNGGPSNDQAAYEAYLRDAFAAKDELDRTLLALIRERRAEPESAAHDVLGLIVHARDDAGRTFSDDEVLGHLYILLVAGHETTTTLAAWTLYLLATEPQWRARVEAEVNAALDASGGQLSVESVRGLSQLDRFIKEVGRLHSPVQTAPRGMVAEAEVAGYTLPVGARVRVALAACHRLPQYFAEPQRFDPDRFAPPREEDRKTPYALVTFGGGPRLCIGVNFAQIEAKAIAVEALRTYRLTPATSEPPKDAGFITVSIPGGIPMRVERK